MNTRTLARAWVALVMLTLAGAPARAQTPVDRAVPVARSTPRSTLPSDADPPVAPTQSAPWVKPPFIHLFQIVAGVGARAALVPVLFVPVVGPPLAACLMPVMEASAITWAGDRLGDGRAPLLVPLVVSGVINTLGLLLGFTGMALMAAALTLSYLPYVFGGLDSPALAALLAGALAVVVAGTLAEAGAWLLAGLSPIASTLAYQAVKRRKSDDDNGGSRPVLLPGMDPEPAPALAEAAPQRTDGQSGEAAP